MSDEEIALELVKLKFKNYDSRSDGYYTQRIMETYKFFKRYKRCK